MTNLLHSANENKISASNFVNIDAGTEYQENCLNICKIFKAGVNSSLTSNINRDKNESKNANLQPEMEISIKFYA